MATARMSIAFTPRGRVLAWLATASLLGAWLSGDDNVRLAAALLLAPLAVDYACKARALHAVAAHVAPRRAVAGAPFRETVTLRSRARARVRELLLAEPHTRGQPALVGPLPPGGRATATLWCQNNARGRLAEREFEVWSDWPLGLLRARASLVVATDLVTEPARVPVDARWLEAATDREGGPRTRLPLPGDEFHALREQEPAEDARGVHALRSAALGTLMRTIVRGREPREIGLVLDLRRPPGRPPHLGYRHLEWSLSACATILDRLRAAHAVVRVFVLGSRTVRTVVADPAHHRQVLTLLAEAAAVEHRPVEIAVLRELEAMEHCIWLPAGGHQAHAELAHAGPRVLLLGEGAG